MNYWLIKSEPDVFSIDDLNKMPKQTDHWNGVRNYQARNILRDQMKCGDQAFFYHSNCKDPGIVGIVTIVKEGYPDFTAFDKKSPYFDPKSDPNKPRWYMTDMRYKRKLKRKITLNELKTVPEIASMTLLQRGNRLSVIPISADHWQFILNME